MEVFVKDMPKNCNVCTFRLKKDWCVCCFLNDSMLATKEKNRPQHCPLNSLDQHDAEVRKHVIAELEEWVNKNTVDFVSEDGYFTAIEPDDLKEKLNEMKGEKDDV